MSEVVICYFDNRGAAPSTSGSVSGGEMVALVEEEGQLLPDSAFVPDGWRRNNQGYGLGSRGMGVLTALSPRGRRLGHRNLGKAGR